MLSFYSFKWSEYKAYFCNLSVLSWDSFVNDILHSQVSARLRGSFGANKEQLFPNKYINYSKCSSEDLRKNSWRRIKGEQVPLHGPYVIRKASRACPSAPMGWPLGFSVIKGHTTKQTLHFQAYCKLARASIATKIIIELQDQWGWKRPLSSSRPTIHPSSSLSNCFFLPCPYQSVQVGLDSADLEEQQGLLLLAMVLVYACLLWAWSARLSYLCSHLDQNLLPASVPHCWEINSMN